MLVPRSIATTNNTESFLVSDSELPAVWLENAPVVYVGTLISVILVTVMVYDILLTLDDERVYVWSSRWSPIKILYLIIRYFPLSLYSYGAITSVFPSKFTCSLFEWYESVGCVFVMAAADMFLAYRVYAFCGKNKYLLSFLIVTFLGWEATVFSLIPIILPHDVNVLSPDPLPHLNFVFALACTPGVYPQKAAVVWVGMLCYQSVLFLCFILSALYKHGIFYSGLILGTKQAPLYRVFVRDGLWAYFVIVVSLALNVAAALKWRILGISFVTLFTVVTSICSCRLILNIRSAAYKPMSISI